MISLKQNSTCKYVKNKWINRSRNVHLWKTIKPFMNEAYSSNSHVPEMSLEKGEFIRNPTDVCNTFNAYFCNNGSDIMTNKKHFDACLSRIHDKRKNQGFSFSFHIVSTSKVMKNWMFKKFESSKGSWMWWNSCQAN